MGYEHHDSLKDDVLYAIFYLGELAGYPRCLHDQHPTLYRLRRGHGLQLQRPCRDRYAFAGGNHCRQMATGRPRLRHLPPRLCRRTLLRRAGE